MPNYYLSVLYKHIIQVENKNVGLKVGGAQTYHCPPSQKSGGAHAPLAPPRFLRQCVYISSMVDVGLINIHVLVKSQVKTAVGLIML